MRATLKKINAELDKHFAGLQLARGKGYYYVSYKMFGDLTPEENKTADMVCTMFETSIVGVNFMNCASLETWVEWVLEKIENDRNLKYEPELKAHRKTTTTNNNNEK